jgi:carbon-monoxide dehydrogenase large subunit
MTPHGSLRFGIGARATRIEDRRFVMGQGRYGDDVSIDGQLYAEFIISPTSAGRVLSLDLGAAKETPGVVGVFTAHDLDADGIGDLPCFATRAAPLQRADGTPAFVPPRPPFARDRVRFTGDILGMVVAETRDAAREGVDAIFPDIEDASMVIDPRDAAAEGAPPVWDDCPDNTAYVFRAGDAEAVDAAIAHARYVAKVEIPFTRLAMTPMEPRTALGVYDAFDGRFTLHCGTQNPHIVRRALAQDVFGVPETDIRIVTPDMGGAFGMRSTVFPEMVAVLWAARALGRPVKWTGTRSAAFLTDDMGRDLHMTADLALDEDGTFEALRVRSVAGLGAYLSLFGPIPTFANIGGLAGVYRTPLISADVRAVFTNLPPIAPYRGAGRPEAIACIELAIEEAARRFGFDRFALRRQNMITPNELPFQTGLTFTYDSGDFPKSMAMATEAADLARVRGAAHRGPRPRQAARPRACECHRVLGQRDGRRR